MVLPGSTDMTLGKKPYHSLHPSPNKHTGGGSFFITATPGESPIRNRRESPLRTVVNKSVFFTALAAPKSALATNPVSSLPDIQAPEQLLREMQKEKERLHRYFQTKERTQKQMQDSERWGAELLKKKQAKLAKIESLAKKEAKELRRKAEEHDFERSKKRKQLED